MSGKVMKGKNEQRKEPYGDEGIEVNTQKVEKPEPENPDADTKAVKKANFWKEVRSYLILITCAAAFALLLNHKIIVNAQVPTGSMESTVMPGDRIIVNRLAYQFSDPERGDIIMFRFPDNEEEEWLKRIVGLPGETLEIRDGRVYVDGSEEALDESFLTVEPTGNFGPYVVPEGAYFVMGDNRENSWDSRYWENTFVKREAIIGKAVLRYFPSFRLYTK